VVREIPGNSSSPFSSPVSEAQEETQKQFQKVYTKCGDSYFSKTLVQGLVEYKDVTFSVKQIDLEEADRLNGVEWKGVAIVKSKLIRFYLSDKRTWTDWQSENAFVNPGQNIGTYTAEKRQGQWKFLFLDRPVVENGNLKCDQIPNSSAMSTPKLRAETEAKPTTAIVSDDDGIPKRRRLSLDDYCRSKHGSSSVAVNTVRVAFAWRCMVEDVRGNKRYFELSMDEACQMQYGSKFRAAVDNPKDFENWHCISNNGTNQTVQRFGAIAYSASTQRWGYSKDFSSREGAERRAITECNAGDCVVKVWFGNACGAIAKAQNGSVGWGWDNSKAVAEGKAMQECFKVGNNCTVLCSVCTTSQ
jgi:serine/threonine-protein kinase